MQSIADEIIASEAANAVIQKQYPTIKVMSIDVRNLYENKMAE